MLREKFLSAIARFACHHYKLVLLIGLILTALAPVPMLRSGYTTAFNVAHMLPQDIPASRAFTRAITDFGTTDEAIIVFRLDQENPRSVEIAGKLADRIAQRVIKHPDINTAFAQMLTKEEKDQLLNVELPRHGMLLLPPKDIEAIRSKLQTAEIKKSVEATARKLKSDTMPESVQQNVLMNALGLGSIFKESFENLLKKDKDEKSGPLAVDTGKKVDGKGYLVSPAGEMLLLVIEPKYPAQSIPFSARTMNFLEQTAYDCIAGAVPFSESDCTDWSKLISVVRDDLNREGVAVLTKKEKADLTEYLSGRGEEKAGLTLAMTMFNRILRTPEATVFAGGPELEAKIEAEAKDIAALGFDQAITEKALRMRENSRLFCKKYKDLLKQPESGDALPSAALKAFKMELAGGYQIARRYGEKINGVMVSTLALSAVCVLAFFGWCFRRYGVLLYIGIPLFMIIMWTAGLGWLLFGQLNIVSCAFAAVLVGLGIDYAVHIYNRYIEERARNFSVEKAFEIAIVNTGWGVLVGMVTTCLAFMALNATRFTQLAEFGALGAIGIFLSAPAMMLIMPALITWRDRRATAKKIRTLQPSEFCLPQIARIVFARRKLVFWLTILAVVISLGALAVPGSIGFNSSMGALRPRDRAFEINGEISAAFASRNPNKFTFMVLGDTEEDALTKMAGYEPKLRELEQRGLIRGYESVTRYLPSPQTQRERLALIKGFDFDRALADFRAALKEQGMEEEYFKFNLNLLTQHKALTQENRIVLPADFRGTKVARLVNQYIARRQKEYQLTKEEFPEKYPVTLAKAAVQFEDNLMRYPAESVLDEAAVRGLNPPGQHPSKRVKSIIIYEGGYAVKATIFPPIEKNSRDGEPHITPEWLQQVGQVLGLEPAQFEAKPDLRDFPNTLTGVAITSSILAQIVKEDFLHLSLWVAAICFCVVNLFYHPRTWQAVLCSLPLLAFMGYYKKIIHLLPGAYDYLWAYFLAVGLLYFVGAVLHRQLGRTLLCFIPVILGMIYLFGFMAVLNLIDQLLGIGHQLDLNFVNILTIPIVIGVGVDNGIHLVNRYYESRRRIKPLVVEIGRALMITTLTTIVGFGSLYTSKFQGMDSIAQLGILSCIAFAAVLIASVISFPAVISTICPRQRRKKAAGQK